ncbi:MAG: OmpA family protein [Bacteroidia bacterium]|nr:OmpA family protein [Bacteroidia bacterium]MDW8015124.1 OmpA family protein [Bacteroidia bacterium]
MSSKARQGCLLGLLLWAQPLEVTYKVEVSTVAGSGRVGYKGGAALEAALNRPNGIFVDKTGTIYFSDDHNHCVRKVTPDGRVVLVAGRPGSAGYEEGEREEAAFNSPHGLTADGNGNLYVCDYFNHAIRKITPGGEVSTFAGGKGGGFKDGPAEEALFLFPIAIVRDSKGNLWVLDGGNHALRKITPQRRVITVAGDGSPGYQDGPGKRAQFNSPVGLAISKEDHLYVVDAGNRCIRRVLPDGTVSTYVDLSFKGWTIRGELMGGLSFATSGGGHGGGVAVDEEGNLYIADGGRHIVYQINAAERTVEILAGSGRPGWIDGNGKFARFHEPVEICIGEKPNVFYVCDYRNAAIRRISIEKLEKYRRPVVADTSKALTSIPLVVRVIEAGSKQPLSGVQLKATPAQKGFPLSTNASGEAQAELIPGNYTLTLSAEKEGYKPQQKALKVTGQPLEVEIELVKEAPLPPPPFFIRVLDENTLTPLEEAQVRIISQGSLLQAGTTSSQGEYRSTLSGNAEIEIEKKGYFPFRGWTYIRPGDSIVVRLKPAVVGAILRETRILFKPNSPQLEPESYPVLDQIADFLRKNPHIRLRIHGHTDIGDPDPRHNQRLSEERAINVRQYLIRKGIDPARLEAVGHGNTRPIADNRTPEGRAQNRRVEFEVISP